MKEEAFIHVLRFWRDLEALSPQPLPKLASRNRDEPVCSWQSSSPIPPWSDRGFLRRPISSKRMWRHGVYANLYARPRFIEMLEQHLGEAANTYEERPTGEGCVFYVAVDERGSPIVETFMLSMAAWALGVIEERGLAGLANPAACDTKGLRATPGSTHSLSNRDFPGFERQLVALREELGWRVGHLPDGEPVALTWFSDFAQLVVRKLKLHRMIGETLVHRIRSTQVSRPRAGSTNRPQKADDDFLNSFFVKDLNRVMAACRTQPGPGLHRYLSANATRPRTDVRGDRARALELLRPRNFPRGSWPSEHPLVWSQQLAVNAIWRELHASNGLFAVNGPPGTGKTTLLRDLVAAVVVERAKLLAAEGSRLLREKRILSVGGTHIPFYPFAAELAGFSIVVASSNNGAVENVSLELPKRSAIPERWLGEADVYHDIASELCGEAAWALVAGRLGNARNRTAFAHTFWWQESERGQHTPGLRERLEKLKQGQAEPKIPWDVAVKQFNAALADEARWRDVLEELNKLRDRLATLEQAGAELNTLRVAHERNRAAEQSALDRTSKEADIVEQLVGRQRQRLEQLKAVEPGFLEWVSTWGRAQRRWRNDVDAVLTELAQYEAQATELGARIENQRHAQAQTTAKIEQLEDRIAENEAERATVAAVLVRAKCSLHEYWPDLLASDEAQERSSPWAHPAWREARIRVFIAAMNVHRAFVESNAHEMCSNIGAAIDMLNGRLPDKRAQAVALESLAIACPVLSTTFASVGFLFSELPPETIGWLLIDEAGQATPQSAAGAIWRARRVVVVGDPMQLEPVVTVPRTVEAALAAHHGGVGEYWQPSRSSVQTLSDRATHIGTIVGVGDGALWVGAPLRVHRRCDDPMFSVSNEIGYAGLMVHQKSPSSASWPPSVWLDIPATTAEGNWIPDEGVVLRELLDALLNNHHVPTESIFVISPFREVVAQLHRIGDKYQLERQRLGTVHTTQGKEAEVVILVLGGGTAGARNWAAAKPNLLNVAVSRAKQRLYVIGDRADWSRRRFFSVLAEHMPTKSVPIETSAEVVMMPPAHAADASSA